MNTEQATVYLRACHSLLQTIEGSGQGMHYQLSAEELLILSGFEDVANAAASRPDGEGWFDEVRQRAGLRPSSSGLLFGVLHSWYASHISPEAQIAQLTRSLDGLWHLPGPDAETSP